MTPTIQWQGECRHPDLSLLDIIAIFIFYFNFCQEDANLFPRDLELPPTLRTNTQKLADGWVANDLVWRSGTHPLRTWFLIWWLIRSANDPRCLSLCTAVSMQIALLSFGFMSLCFLFPRQMFYCSWRLLSRLVHVLEFSFPIITLCPNQQQHWKRKRTQRNLLYQVLT